MSDETLDERDGELGALRTARDEARTTLDAQLAALDDIDAKALAVFRLDVALVGVLVSALSFAAESDATPAGAFLNPATGVGIALFAVSAAAAGLTYTTVGQHVGVGPAGIERADGHSERAYLAALVDGYADWIRHNERVNVRKALLVTLSILGTLAGALALAVGTAFAVTGQRLLPALGALTVLLAFAALAGLPGVLRRLVNPPEEPVGGVTPQSLDVPLPGQRTLKGPDRED